MVIITDKKECPVCGAEVDASALECPVCGSVLDFDEIPEEDRSLCPSCGRIVSIHAPVCPYCGEVFEMEDEGLSEGLMEGLDVDDEEVVQSVDLSEEPLEVSEDTEAGVIIDETGAMLADSSELPEKGEEAEIFVPAEEDMEKDASLEEVQIPEVEDMEELEDFESGDTESDSSEAGEMEVNITEIEDIRDIIEDDEEGHITEEDEETLMEEVGDEDIIEEIEVEEGELQEPTKADEETDESPEAGEEIEELALPSIVEERDSKKTQEEEKKAEEEKFSYEELEPLIDEKKMKMDRYILYSSISLILFGAIGIAFLVSYFHNFMRFPANLYIGFGYQDTMLGIIGFVFFLLGVIGLIYLFMKRKYRHCSFCGAEIDPENIVEAITDDDPILREYVVCPKCGLAVCKAEEFDERDENLKKMFYGIVGLYGALVLYGLSSLWHNMEIESRNVTGAPMGVGSTLLSLLATLLFFFGAYYLIYYYKIERDAEELEVRKQTKNMLYWSLLLFLGGNIGLSIGSAFTSGILSTIFSFMVIFGLVLFFYTALEEKKYYMSEGEFCPACGVSVSEDEDVCPKCGAELHPESIVEEEKELSAEKEEESVPVIRSHGTGRKQEIIGEPEKEAEEEIVEEEEENEPEDAGEKEGEEAEEFVPAETDEAVIIEEKIVCPNCGASLPAGSTVCFVCDTILKSPKTEGEAEEEETDETEVEDEISPEAMSVSELEEENEDMPPACPVCGVEVSSTDTVCPVCGAELIPEENAEELKDSEGEKEETTEDEEKSREKEEVELLEEYAEEEETDNQAEEFEELNGEEELHSEDSTKYSEEKQSGEEFAGEEVGEIAEEEATISEEPESEGASESKEEVMEEPPEEVLEIRECPVCGAEISAGTTVCPICGNEIDIPSSTDNEESDTEVSEKEPSEENEGATPGTEDIQEEAAEVPEALQETEEVSESTEERNEESREEESLETMECPICNAEIPAGEVVCPVCGSELELPSSTDNEESDTEAIEERPSEEIETEDGLDSTEPEEEIVECPTCGATVSAFEDMCPICGAALKSE